MWRRAGGCRRLAAPPSANVELPPRPPVSSAVAVRGPLEAGQAEQGTGGEKRCLHRSTACVLCRAWGAVLRAALGRSGCVLGVCAVASAATVAERRQGNRDSECVGNARAVHHEPWCIVASPNRRGALFCLAACSDALEGEVKTKRQLRCMQPACCCRGEAVSGSVVVSRALRSKISSRLSRCDASRAYPRPHSCLCDWGVQQL